MSFAIGWRSLSLTHGRRLVCRGTRGEETRLPRTAAITPRQECLCRAYNKAIMLSERQHEDVMRQCRRLLLRVEETRCREIRVYMNEKRSVVHAQYAHARVTYAPRYATASMRRGYTARSGGKRDGYDGEQSVDTLRHNGR